MQTLSAYLKSPFLFDLRSISLPDTPPPNHLLLKVEACGICGTDLTIAHQAADFSPFGHEIAGVVQSVGPNVTNVKPGDRVVLETSSYCGTCDLCRNGRVDLCRKAPGFWGKPAMGMSHYMITPACAAVPYANLTPEQACLTEPAGVAYDMVKVADIRLGDRVCLVGPGPIGLMALALAKAAGATRLACIGHSHSTARMNLARDLGAEPIPHDGDITDLKDLAKQFDHVLMTAPVRFIPQALSLLDYEGKMTFIGIGHGNPQITLDANDFHFRKLQLRSSFASPAVYFPRTLSLITSGVLPIQKFISHTFPLRDIAKAMHTAQHDKSTAIKVIIKPEHD